jgi:hypothetical protein
MTDRPSDPPATPDPAEPPDGRTLPSLADALRLIMDLAPSEAGEDEAQGGDPACWAHLFEEDEADEAPDGDERRKTGG